MDGPPSSRSRYLASDERIVREVHRHIAMLLRPFCETVGVIILASILGTLTSPDRGDHPIDTLLGWITIFFAMRFFWKGLAWWHDRIVLTDQRIFEVSGLLTRRVASMPLSKLTDLTYRRTLWGRVLGFGELVVETAGQAQALGTIGYLARPDDFYRTVTSLVATQDVRARPAAQTLSPHPQPDRTPARPPERADPEPLVRPWRSEPDDDDTGPLPRAVL